MNKITLSDFTESSFMVCFVQKRRFKICPHGELNQIKQRLSITEVLQHYNLKPDSNHRLHCPFHPDKTPSLQIYPKTNTYCCFSSNCTAGTGDQVQFIELMEKCTKHEALLKAASLTGLPGSSNLHSHEEKEDKTSTDELSRIAVLTKIFSYYKTGLPRSERAVDL